MTITRILGVLALTSTLALAQQSGQDATGHGQTPPSTNRSDSKVDLNPAGTSLKDQFKLSNVFKKDAAFQVAHQKPVVKRDPFQKQTPK